MPATGSLAVKPLLQCQLYAFVDKAYLRGRAPEAVAQQLCEGGADLIQLRAKHSSLEEIRRMAKAILPVTRASCISLVINDRLAVAQEVGAEVCHLGQEDFFDVGYTHVAQLPAQLGCDPARGRPVSIGLSTHSPDQAQRALAAGPAYLAIGPVYPTATKPTAKPVTLDYVRWAAAHVTIHWFAIGGIKLAHLDEVLAAGAQRICAVSAILNADDPADACRKFKDRLGHAHSGG